MSVAATNQRKLVITFHDLHPGTLDLCRRFIDRVKQLGVPKIGILLVPNWYHQGPIHQEPEFCEWLRSLDHDISLHGYAHRAGHRPEKPWEWLMANKYTAGEGEFYKLPVREADRLISQGLELFRQAGVSPSGFIAPAWLMEDAHIPLIEKAGLSYCVTFRKIYDLNRLRKLYAPVLCTTSRTQLRRMFTRQVVSALAVKHAEEDILRIAVHPVDLLHRNIEDFICRLIEQCLEKRESTTYADLVRSSPSINSRQIVDK